MVSEPSCKYINIDYNLKANKSKPKLIDVDSIFENIENSVTKKCLVHLQRLQQFHRPKLMQSFHVQFVWRIFKWEMRITRCPAMNTTYFTLVVSSHGQKSMALVPPVGLNCDPDIPIDRGVSMDVFLGLVCQRPVTMDHSRARQYCKSIIQGLRILSHVLGDRS